MVVFNNALAGAAGSGGAAADFKIERSLRFNSADEAYLSKDFSSSNRRTWTWSGWVKLCKNKGQVLFHSYSAQSDSGAFFIDYLSSGSLRVLGWNTTWRSTSAVFRDFSAWQHVIVAVDTTNTTPNDRIKVYVNGNEITDFSPAPINPGQDDELAINQAATHRIGNYTNGTTNYDYLDSYLAEVHFVDGQALDETSFGEFDADTGVWNPIRYTGTYGTNGFHLDFSDNSTNDALGNDAAGSNDWDVNNLVATGSQDGISATAPQGSGGDWAGVVGFTPSNTNGSVATLPDGGGQDNTNGRFSWSGLSVGDTITLHLTTGSDTSNRSVFGDVDESTTGGSPGSTLGTITLTASAASGSAKIDFNGTASIYGITPGPVASRFVDDCLDSPTNYDDETNIGGNYATMNALHQGGTTTLKNGNLVVDNTGGSASWATTISSIGMSSGKWYAEVHIAGSVASFGVGVSASDTAYMTSYHGQTSDSYCWFVPSGGLYTGGAYTNANAPWNGSLADGDVIGLALDMDNGTLRYYKNGTLQGGGDAFTDITGTQFFATCSYGHIETWNFGATPFAHTLPTGYKALCTQNFDDPEISKGSDYFDAKLYTGNSSTTPRDITGLSFSPDLVWVKSRTNPSSGHYHHLHDTVRGLSNGFYKNLYSNTDESEDTYPGSTYGGISAINSDGFTLSEGSDASNKNNLNKDTIPYVAWTWDGGDLVTNSAYNQSQTWSDNVSNPSGAYGVASNAFDGNLNTHASPNNANPMTYTNPSASDTVISTFRIYTEIYDDTSIVLELNGTDIKSQVNTTTGWHTITGFTGQNFSTLKWSADPSNYECRVKAVEVNGKLLVDSGVIPAGSMNSSAYDQSRTWSTYGTFDNNHGSGYEWDDVFNTNMNYNADGSLYVPANVTETWTLTAGVAVTSSVKVYTYSDTTVIINSGESTETSVTGSLSGFGYVEVPFSGTVNKISLEGALSGGNTGSIYVMGIWFDGKQLVDTNETVSDFPSFSSTVRANPTSGFSIITLDFPTYSGQSTVAHGLNAAPHFWTMKDLDSQDGWYTGHISLGGGDYFMLDLANPASQSATIFGDTLPDSNFIYNNGTSMTAAGKYVMYAWAPVEGYSAFGSYTGNGDTSGNGPFVYTGFRPALVMIKTVSTNETGWTFVQDSAREPNNVSDSRLFWGDANYEVTATGLGGTTSYEMDILSNGFKIRNAHGESNITGKKYVYACWAENPFKTARAR